MKEKLINIICAAKQAPTLVDIISQSSDLINDIGLDSLQLINVILKIEDEFDIQINFEEFDMNSLRTIDSLCDYINSQKEV